MSDEIGMALTRALEPEERQYVDHALATVESGFVGQHSRRLDFSLDSLAYVDALVRGWAGQTAALPPDERGHRLVTFVRLFAPYVAECLVRARPGAELVWGQGQVAVQLSQGPVRATFFAASRIAKALEGDVAVSQAISLWLAALDHLADLKSPDR